VTFRLINGPTGHSNAPISGEDRQTIDPFEINSSASGYVPYRMHEPFPVRTQYSNSHHMQTNKTKATEPEFPPRVKNASQENKLCSNQKPDCLYISSSMFRELNEYKMSLQKHTAKALFYPGANSHQMLKRLLQDREFHSLDKSAIKQIFILTGTNYIDALTSGDITYQNAVTGINEICFKLWEIFLDAKISVVNILPRADRHKNVFVDKLNGSIREMCLLHGLNYVDTEFKNKLFCERNGNRKQLYFRNGYFDDVHLNKDGIARLGRHLKYLAHIR
jgi:hypothetical protein